MTSIFSRVYLFDYAVKSRLFKASSMTSKMLSTVGKLILALTCPFSRSDILKILFMYQVLLYNILGYCYERYPIYNRKRPKIGGYAGRSVSSAARENKINYSPNVECHATTRDDSVPAFGWRYW